MKAMILLEAMTDIDASLIANAPAERKAKGKSFTRLLILAALIAALTMTAFAASEAVNWFKEYFSRYSELTPNQIAFIEEKERQNQLSKLTADQAKGDIVKSILDELERVSADEDQ